MFFEDRKVKRLGRVRVKRVSKAKNLLSEVKVAIYLPRSLHTALKRKAKHKGYSLHHAIRLALMQWAGDGWEDERPLPLVPDDKRRGPRRPVSPQLGKTTANSATRRAEREFLLERMRDELPGTRPLFVEYLDDDGTGQWAFVKGSEG